MWARARVSAWPRASYRIVHEHVHVYACVHMCMHMSPCAHAHGMRMCRWDLTASASSASTIGSIITAVRSAPLVSLASALV